MAHKTVRIIAIAICLVFALTMVGCSSSKAPSTANTTGGSASAASTTGGSTSAASNKDTGVMTKTGSGKNTLVIGFPSDIQGFDPHYFGGTNIRIWGQIYETLLYKDEKGEFRPALAETWEKVDDTHYKFKIRDGVTFHSGNVCDAQAIADCYNMKNDTKNPHTHYGFTNWIKKAYAEAGNILIIETNKVFPSALHYLAIETVGAVYDVKASKERGDLKKDPSGTGPYMLDSWKAGQRIVLKRNPNYWGKKPNLEYIDFEIIVEESTRILALQNGDIDVTFDLSPESWATLEKDSNIVLNKYRQYGAVGLEFNFLKPIFKENYDLREAISLAIDTQAIIKNIYGVTGDLADSVVLDTSWGYSSTKCVEYDPELAKSMLDKAGFVDTNGDGIREKDGEKLSFDIYTDYTRIYGNSEVCQAIQDYLKKVGIELKCQLCERAVYTDVVVNQGTQFFNLKYWGGPTNEAQYWIYPRFHTECQELGDWGTARTRMPELDALIEDAMKSTDEAECLKKWAVVQNYICDNTLFIPIAFLNNLQAARKDVKGLIQHPDQWFSYRYMDVSFAK